MQRKMSQREMSEHYSFVFSLASEEDLKEDLKRVVGRIHFESKIASMIRAELNRKKNVE